MSRPPPTPFDLALDKRKQPMTALIREAFDGPISLLEVGTWCGIGSTQVWLKNVKDGSKVTLVDAWKPYASSIDLEAPYCDYRGMELLSSDAFLSAYVAVRKFESECQNRNIDIRLVRADSHTMLPCLCADGFDFIYIDGDHKYEKAKSDIKNAKRLIKKDFGIICGDDLERHPTADLVEAAKSFQNQDYVGEPYDFHPGVLLAISEEFSKVSMVNGFWWVVCRNDVFTDT